MVVPGAPRSGAALHTPDSPTCFSRFIWGTDASPSVSLSVSPH